MHVDFPGCYGCSGCHLFESETSVDVDSLPQPGESPLHLLMDSLFHGSDTVEADLYAGFKRVLKTLGFDTEVPDLLSRGS